jgi:hypothetical protein
MRQPTLGLVSIVVLAAAPYLRAQGSFTESVRPILARHCSTCHNEKMVAAGLSFDSFRDESAARRNPELWPRVLERLAAGTMPPPALPRLTEGELKSIANWIRASFPSAASAPAGPSSRVTIRRLNRAEYNNTIRDLLGVVATPASDFPLDDSGYGFDNIADVLSLSPMLMEKYMASARKLSRLAVYGEPLPPQPTTIGHYLGKHSHDARRTLAAPNITPFSLRGAIYFDHLFPWDAEYEFRYRVVNFRYVLTKPGEKRPTEEELKKLFPTVDAVLSIDGVPVNHSPIIGNLAMEFDRGDLVARVPVKAGEHHVRVSFPHLADIDDPLSNVNQDLRRKLWFDYLDIVGPFEPNNARPEAYRKVFTCRHGDGRHTAACRRTIISNQARRAYRRPPNQQEVASLMAIAQRGDSFEEGIRLALQAVLVSPSFLFRIERKPAAGPEIDEYALASRLSYFLWSSMPDEDLLRAAADKTLRKPDVLTAQVRRMLADPKSSALIDNFASQWLQLRALARSAPDPERFPKVDEELLDFMEQETKLFAQAVIREDRSVLDFLNAKFVYVNGALARHYGIPGVSGEEFRRVELDGNQRLGVLTHGSILTVSSYPTRTSPVLRGKWVLENLLGTPPPPPPPEVPELTETGVGASVSLRERLQQHRANPACASCHEQMDPIGFGLESFDAVGAWRTHDGTIPIDASGKLPNGRVFHGPRELIANLGANPELFTRNITERLLTYALGRGLERDDSAAVDQIGRRLAADNQGFSSLVLAIVNSKPFQTTIGTGVKP